MLYGNYNPDWAIVFREGDIDKIYFGGVKNFRELEEKRSMGGNFK